MGVLGECVSILIISSRRRRGSIQDSLVGHLTGQSMQEWLLAPGGGRYGPAQPMMAMVMMMTRAIEVQGLVSIHVWSEQSVTGVCK